MLLQQSVEKLDAYDTASKPDKDLIRISERKRGTGTFEKTTQY
jgi:hypothetical protein